MDCRQVKFTRHAVERMFARAIQKDEILYIVASGKIIAEYPDDTPYPSYLILGFLKDRPIHVVLSVEPGSRACHIVTVYQPNPRLWFPSFNIRRPS
jgi:hypothetical protein